jgi:hypothetical protein
MAKYLFYVKLSGGGEAFSDADSIDEAVEMAGELIRNTFGSGYNLVTFSVGDVSDWSSEEVTTALKSNDN